MTETKKCSKCHETKHINEFYNQKSNKDGKESYCKKCHNKKSKNYHKEHKEEIAEYSKNYHKEHKEEIAEYSKNYQQENIDKIRQKRGQQPMYENKLCASYLGVFIAERLVRHLFKDVEVMPYGFSGYDIICNKGKKINVKSACVTFNDKNTLWKFNIDYNKIPDYFILVAFDNRTDINPLHLWMIPGKEINNNASKSIRPSTLYKWDEWKRNIEDAQICCTEIKEANKMRN